MSAEDINDSFFSNFTEASQEEGEDIRVYTVSSDECFAMLRDGQLCNATATIAIQWLMLNRDRIRREAGVSGP